MKLHLSNRVSKVVFNKLAFGKNEKLGNPLMVVCKRTRKMEKQATVFPRIVSAGTILFWKLKCSKYSREETIVLSTFCLHTYSNLPNNRVGPIIYVGGRFLRN